MTYSTIKKSLSRTYDDLAVYWGSDKTLHDWGQEDLKKLSKLVGKGAKVLDLGCASGYQSKMLFELDCKVTGLDLSPGMIRAAKKRVPGAKFIVGDMTNLPFKNGEFDGVYARASILHIPKSLVPKVLKGINKVLKKGGVFYLALKKGNFEGEVNDKRHGMEVKRFFSFFNKREIVELLDKSGFKVESVNYYKRPGGSTTWIKIFSRKDNVKS